jgi:DNA-binding GntR family transcriptional regulator
MHSISTPGPAFEADLLQRPALHRELVERLRDMIVDGSLAPGEHLNERALCERFGVSRTPLREAVLILAREGLVEIMPRRGSRVAVLGIEQVRDIIELLGGLEAMAGELACQRATEAAVAAVKARHAEMLGFFEAGDMLSYFKANEEVHDLIVASAGNTELTAQHRVLRARVLRALYMPNIKPERWRAAISEHEAFIDAFADRDGPRLSRLLRAHKERTWNELRAWLERQNRNDAGTGKARRTTRAN